VSPQQQSGEKTEKATPKKKREAREKGQVFKSTELITAFSLIVMFGALSIFGKMILDNTKQLLVSFLNAGDEIPKVLTISTLSPFLSKAFVQFLTIMIPVLLAAFIAALVFNYLQVGFLFSPKAAKPKMERISPAAGFKRIFSKRTLVELLKSIIYIAVLGVVAYDEYMARIKDMPMLMWGNLVTSVQASVDILFGVAFKMAIALAILAPFDFLYQWWKHQKDLMMTKQEVKDEYKLTEGNPEIKGKIRQKQRQMSAMRMMQAVPNADVIITNPTHYAIALGYDDSKHSAPVILAKGKDYVAKKIREIAAEHRIEIVENKPLAQYLYFFCDIGDEVPEEMYQAVAEILAYVYKIKQRLRGVRT
jgi:flagellar biosynthetic protein FlhB